MPDSAITPQQTKAIAALLAPDCHTNAQAARRAGVSLRTLARWLAEDTAFREALAQAQADMIARASMRLVALTDAALVSLADALGPFTPHKYSLRAAELVLSHAVKYHDHVDLAARVDQLEADRDDKE